ncbi:RES family NAD+ phosphorylase [Ornithinimicrobium cavernae]|uniref:RES family NAD+ phosphorylase n=1 Tax=Ornithinimicrobium cavernae TaxID=2666047 RepID=UPI00137A8B1E|nr:RES family NAD+ phosphorylase [Ornithinimicrobium cavernae]
MTAPRARPAQQPPPEAAVLRTGLPRVGPSRRLYREHGLREGDDGGCWWFASSGDGRFDLEDPHGTCYFGGTEGVAVRERCGRLMAMQIPITERLYAGRVVSEVCAPESAGALADLTSPAALMVGVTGELAATSDYALCQAWARACWDAGFGGLRYPPRFTPGGKEAAFAIFGDEGHHPDPGVLRRRDLLDVLQELGYPAVRSDELGSTTLDIQDNAEPV